MRRAIVFGLAFCVAATCLPLVHSHAIPPDGGRFRRRCRCTGRCVELQILDWEGVQKLLASKKGKIVVLDAWSTSCVPCVREFPNLVGLHKRLG